jgi:hypothetical protein
VKGGAAFTIENALAHIKKRKRDPWEGYGRLKQRITEPALRTIATLQSQQQ